MTATATCSPEADTALRARLELFAGIGSDLGVRLPLCPLVTRGCRSFAARARPRLGHAEGTAVGQDVARSLPAMVASSGDG